MSEKISAQSADTMQPLRKRYLEYLDKSRADLERLVEKLAHTDLNASESETLLELAHKLVGNGATYGFPDITETAKSVEDLLSRKDWRPKDVLTMPAQSGISTKEYETMRALVEQLRIHCDALGLGKQSDAAKHLGEALSQEISLPRKTMVWHLQNLMDACAAARMAKPVDHKSSSSRLAGKAPTPANDPANRQHPLVLIVDDDDNARDILAMHVKGFADVITGTDTREAFEQMKRYRPNLVLLDEKMPGAPSGVKLLEGIRGKPGVGDIPVVMISASHDLAIINRALRAGAVDYITKPFNPAVIGKRIKNRLDRRGQMVLIIDDDLSICDLLSRTLAAAGFVVRQAWNGQLALDIMRQHPPDLVLLDYVLPGLNGSGVLQSMSASKLLSRIPVIMITAFKDMAGNLGDTDFDIAGYISKPFDPDSIADYCASILDSRAVAKNELEYED